MKDKKKMFDYCIGNPPFNSDFSESGQNGNYAKPVYNVFMDATYEVAEKVELIHPARFLFNAGSTPKAWNDKMLHDEHFEILRYEQNSDVFFPSLATPIKGGIAISYRDNTKSVGAIGIFTPFPELNTIMHKVWADKNTISLSSICVSSYAYHFTETLHKENPLAKNVMSKGHFYDLKSNVIDKLTDIFISIPSGDENDYLKVIGRTGTQRVYKYIKRDYIATIKNTDLYKVIISAATGAGQFGETFADPIIAEPGVISTETFSSMGAFSSASEAENCKSYIKTKFSRALLGILKSTQHLTPENWKYVPLQDFTSNSDIDWSKSIHEIDLQLYQKYGLTAEEINFIEANVKEMA